MRAFNSIIILPYLECASLKHDEAVVGLPGHEDDQGLGPGRPEPEADLRRAPVVFQGKNHVTGAGKGCWNKREIRVRIIIIIKIVQLLHFISIFSHMKSKLKVI